MSDLGQCGDPPEVDETWTDKGIFHPPGPPAPPLVAGHLGAPSEDVCRAAMAVLGACELLGDEELMRLAENRVRDLGISPQQLQEWGRSHTPRPVKRSRLRRFLRA